MALARLVVHMRCSGRQACHALVDDVSGSGGSDEFPGAAGLFSGTKRLSPATDPACRIRLRLGFASTHCLPFFDVGTCLTPRIRVHSQLTYKAHPCIVSDFALEYRFNRDGTMSGV